MAQLDKLISMMVTGDVERAVLLNDRAAHLFSHGQDKPGPIIPGAQLQAVVQEVVPDSLKARVGGDEPISFTHASPHGAYDVAVVRQGTTLQVTVTPHKTDASKGDAASDHGAQAVAVLSPRVGNGSTNGDDEGGVDDLSALADALAAGLNGDSNGASTTPTSAATPAVPRAPLRHVEHLDELFRLMQERDASDLHMSSDEFPIMRVQGRIDALKEYERLSPEALKDLLWVIAPSRNREQWEDEHDTDFAYELEGVARFRCNFFADRKGIGAVFRLIPSQVLTVQQLNLPKAVVDLCFLSKGLVVVTGPTGSGKSTTLAAMVDFINKQRDDHIITIEDPVEFVHNNIKCLVNQREVHVHTDSFKRALRAALREDPDIVLVGEMRDLETIAIAIETAETGHLVFGTLHTTTAPSTVDRIIDQFPPGQQAQIRVMLSESLKGVIAQTLLRTKDGKRVAAHEILLCPSSVANLIREGKTFQLPSQMQINKGIGMVTMNDSILEHVKSGRVDPHEGYVKAVDKIGLLGSYEALGLDYSPSNVGRD